MKVTGATITDEQIHQLFEEEIINSAQWHFALYPKRDATREFYRELCARLWEEFMTDEEKAQGKVE
jgi:hypothetical protein